MATDSLDGPALNALISKKLKELAALQAAFNKLYTKGGGSVSGSSEKKKRAGRGPIAWTEWTRKVRELYPKQWSKWSAAKSGTVVQFAAAMREHKPDDYAAFEAKFKAEQAAAAAAVSDSDSSEDEAPKKKTSSAPRRGGAGAGATAHKAVASDSSSSSESSDSDSDSEEEVKAPPSAPASVTRKKPVRKPVAAPAAAAATAAPARTHAAPVAKPWNFEGHSYYKTDDNGVWEDGIDEDDGTESLVWCGVYVPDEGRIDNMVDAPATKPTKPAAL
jgi:hypothetical protein